MATPRQIKFLADLGMDPRDARKLTPAAASAEIRRRKDLRDGPPASVTARALEIMKERAPGPPAVTWDPSKGETIADARPVRRPV